jgi:hypothetical protein
MSSLAFRRPTVLPIHRQTWVRPAGNTDFRVTQRFAVPDSFHGGTQQHNAVDLGNFSCGGAVVAMAPGITRRTQDNATALGAKTNALGMIVDHGNGITSESWHLNGYSVASGVRVTAGQQIGIVGRTGLGDVCHLHVEVKRLGVRIDPEPLMFGTPLSIEEEDDVKIPAGLKPLASAVVGSGNRLRVDADTTTDSRIIGGPAPTGIGEDKAYWVQVYGFGVPGAAYTLDGKAGSLYAWVGVFGSTWFVAEPLLTQLTPSGQLTLPAPPPADCSAQETTIARLTLKIARARTANNGARQAQAAVETALA